MKRNSKVDFCFSPILHLQFSLLCYVVAENLLKKYYLDRNI
jgi:hypothetical protein